MKQKKETLVSKALDLMGKHPNMKPKEMAEKLGVTTQRVYVLRNTLKKKLAKKASSNVTTKPVRMKTKATTGRPSNYVLDLESENEKLAGWLLLWKQKYETLERDYTQAKVMFLNSQAVVEYLENKVANLITINNLKGK